MMKAVVCKDWGPPDSLVVEESRTWSRLRARWWST
jgi:hypothetical protein